ncbi:hypothetical protein P8C59_008352 [Phyllachora maydis]|uniref:Uncharacterized protein n=1 Tax=Phyllachora maydis TaxID=1825666 RepID=A0AAD9IA97_9PEZI|nr:hypothetical protein P8C59_008352 [Phyllachora maydis]
MHQGYGPEVTSGSRSSSHPCIDKELGLPHRPTLSPETTDPYGPGNSRNLVQEWASKQDDGEYTVIQMDSADSMGEKAKAGRE